MNNIETLEPKVVWQYFLEICKIPRPSKKEEKIINYLLDFGKNQNLPTKKDKTGNVLISKPATKGLENLQTVVLQSHMDMVCERHSNVQHNFDKDPIRPVIEDGWIIAQGTTLGADNGIGMATQLAILSDKNIEHGPIECLFTVDEETGLTGAFGLEENFFSGNILINLDSEDDGEIFIGCAGGKDTIATLNYLRKKVKKNPLAYKISISDLKGGHSGDDIDKGRGNSIKILNRLLWYTAKEFEMRLVELKGGNLRNAIPREAYAMVTIPPDMQKPFESYCKLYTLTIREELLHTDPAVKLSIKAIDTPEYVINRKTQCKLLNALYACPNGVMKISYEIENLVETSTNLASVKFEENNKIIIATSQRSSLDSALKDISFMVESVFTLSGAKVLHGGEYPGWTPKVDSPIVTLMKTAYENLFHRSPKIRAIHAGLECGLFLKKYPDLDMASIGPSIENAHSPDERLHIESTQKFWKWVLEVLKNIPEKTNS